MIATVCAVQSAVCMADVYAMTKVLTRLCTVLSPINALSSRSNFISEHLNNQSGVISVRPHKAPTGQQEENPAPNRYHGVKNNRLDNHIQEV